MATSSPNYDEIIRNKLEILFYIDLYNDLINQYNKDVIQEKIIAKKALEQLVKIIYINNERKDEEILKKLDKNIHLETNKHIPDIIAELLKLLKKKSN